MRLHVKNWQKYQGDHRQGHKCWWFKLTNEFFTTQDLFGLNHISRLVWLYILCECSKQATDTPKVRKDYLVHILGIKTSELNSALISLSELTTVLEQPLHSGKTVLGQEEERRGEKRREEYLAQSANADVSDSDLDLIYQEYPRKIGKSQGMKKLAREIKTKDLLADCLKAVKNYSNSVKTTEAKYIKHFSTWVTEWRDWINPEPEKVSNSWLTKTPDWLKD